MSNFIETTVIDHYGGVPGIVEKFSYSIFLNLDQVTVIGEDKDKNLSFVKLTCGTSLTIKKKFNDLVNIIKKSVSGCVHDSIDHSSVFISIENITFFTKTDDPNIVLMRLSCGSSIMINITYDDIKKQIGEKCVK